MSKFSSFEQYPKRSLDNAEAALLTIWPGLNRFHNDMVLVGGLAVKYLTKPAEGILPGAVTIDVDLGFTIATEGGMYGSVADDLIGQGFTRTPDRARFVKQVEGMPLYIDFLTEHPTAMKGTTEVEDISMGIFPGVNRALATRRKVSVSGKDLFGCAQTTSVNVAGIGALLVLKLNAFADRQQPKDAYDILLATSLYVDGPQAAVKAFHAEAEVDNRGFPIANAALSKFFCDIEQSGPRRCAEFLASGARGADATGHNLRVRQQMVTIGKALAQM